MEWTAKARFCCVSFPTYLCALNITKWFSEKTIPWSWIKVYLGASHQWRISRPNWRLTVSVHRIDVMLVWGPRDAVLLARRRKLMNRHNKTHSKRNNLYITAVGQVFPEVSALMRKRWVSDAWHAKYWSKDLPSKHLRQTPRSFLLWYFC